MPNFEKMPQEDAAQESQEAEAEKDFVEEETERLDDEEAGSGSEIGRMIEEEVTGMETPGSEPLAEAPSADMPPAEAAGGDMEVEGEKEFIRAIERTVDDEAEAYVKTVMDSVRNLPGSAKPNAEQMIRGLSKDVLERLKASEASMAGITEDSEAIRALVRKGLKKALEAEMKDIGGSNLEDFTKVMGVLQEFEEVKERPEDAGGRETPGSAGNADRKELRMESSAVIQGTAHDIATRTIEEQMGNILSIAKSPDSVRAMLLNPTIEKLRSTLTDPKTLKMAETNEKVARLREIIDSDSTISSRNALIDVLSKRMAKENDPETVSALEKVIDALEDES